MSLADGDGATDNESAGYIVKAANAEFTVDGLALSSATNSPADAISGVTFQLLAKTEADKPLTLTVGQDTTAVTSNVKKFVDAYNKLISTSNSLTSVVKVGEDGTPLTGGLVGDATVRTLVSGVRNELVALSGGQGNIRALADLGITTQQNGTLKIDDDKLSAELQYITRELHNTNLQRCDRMSMAHSLEVRVPFLDVDLVSYAFKISNALKFSDVWKAPIAVACRFETLTALECPSPSEADRV